MGSYLSWICATKNIFHAILYSYLSAIWGSPRNLVVVGWAEEEGLLLITVWGALGWHIGIVYDRLDITLVPLMMCRVLVWSRPLPLQIWSLVGGSGPKFLWGRFLEQVRSMSCRWPQNASIVGEAKVCICVAARIQLVVPGSVYTSNNRVIELNYVWFHCSKYSYFLQGFWIV